MAFGGAVYPSNPHVPTDAPPKPEWVYVPQGPGSWRELYKWVAEDWRAHERDWTRPGFRAVAMHRFGNFRMRVKPFLLRLPLSVVYWSGYRFIRNHYGIELPYSVKLGRRVVIEHQGAIVIHGDTVIGDGCIIRQGVTLGNRRLNEPFDAPVLGQRVNVGAGAKILGKVAIGDDASIGANSVVLTDVPSGRIAIGIPAKVLPNRDES
jgi:serine O-acetyltransferase